MSKEKNNLVIPVEMLEGIEGYGTKYVAEFLKSVSNAMVKQFEIKDKDYDGSWQKDGLLSVHFNFKRKVDRILAQFNNGTMTSGEGENIGDTLIDMATYTLMYAYFLKYKDKNVSEFFYKFLQKFNSDVEESEQ